MTEPQNQMPADLPWIEAADNPWGVRVLDVRPITLNMLSMSQDPLMAQNAVSYSSDDGTGFIGQTPASSRVIDINLTYRIDRFLADGSLFIPRVMEHKWAIYYHRQQIFFIRSWLREVQAIAEVRVSGDHIVIESLRGMLIDEGSSPEFTVRMIDYLIRSHALDLIYPAPLPADLAGNTQQAGMWCMSAFGNRALVAAVDPLPFQPPDKPLRTNSLLHIAAARGDVEAARQQLAQGLPIDLLAQNGMTALHWALVSDMTEVADLLLAQGLSVDVRSAEGATPLMNAVQGHHHTWMAYLFNHGADANATDNRGFTALHRAAEMGDKTAVELLLGQGANAQQEAHGYTPLSLARQREETEIVQLLESSRGSSLN